MTQANTRPPRLASTLILLSAHPETGKVMIAMLKRALSARFLPGALVFPGGTVEDQDDQVIGHLMNHKIVQEALSDHKAWGIHDRKMAAKYLGAALRETEEESGLNLAILTSGIHTLRCVGHWLTPEALKTRFDTYFWAAEVSSEHSLPTLRVDGAEIERGSWFDPSKILSAHEQAKIDLPAPTLCIIAELADLIKSTSGHASQISSLIQMLNQAAHLHPICPVLDRSHEVRLYLPGDRRYLEKRGDSPRVGSTDFWQVGTHFLERATMRNDHATSSIWRRITHRPDPEI